MTLRKSLRAWRAPIALACAAALAISPAAATAQSTSGSADCPDATLAPAADNLPRVAAAVLCLLNAERASAGVAPLAPDAQLARASQPMADRMVTEQFFSHDTPDGRTLLDRVQPTGYLPRSATWVIGENLAWGSGPLATPQAIVAGWMNSPPHRANVLAPDYRDIGIGLALGSPVATYTGGTTYVTDFGERAPAAAATGLTVSVPRHVSSKATRALVRGVAFRASCSRRCTLVGRLFLNAKTARAAHLRSADAGSLRLARAGHGIVTVRLTAGAKRAVRRLGHLTMTLVTTASGTSVTRTTRVTLT